MIYTIWSLINFRFCVKYKDGILEDIDRPLNPKTRNIKDQGNTVSKLLRISRNLGDIPGANPLNDDFNDSFTKPFKNTLKSETLDKIKGYQI